MMSTIYRDQAGRPTEACFQRGEDKKCCVCNTQNSDGSWEFTGGDLRICYRCAVKTLPVLIADAMAAQPDAKRLLAETHEKMCGAFWRAAALALARDPEPAQSAELTEFKKRQLQELVDFERSLAGDPDV
jgi:hypothetical protein